MSRARSSTATGGPRLDLSAKRHFLFDLDGTLVDSSGAHESAYRAALAGHSAELASTFRYETTKGKRTVEVFRAPARLDRLVAAKQAAYRAAVERGEIAPFEGASRLLDRLREAGRSSFLVTGASRRSTDEVLRRCGLAAAFVGTVTADDVAEGKPRPDCFQLAVRRWELAPEACLVIEDAEAGVAAARGAGLHVAVVNAAELEGDLTFPTLDVFRAAVEAAL